MNIIFEDKALQELYEHGCTSDKKYRKYNKDKKFLIYLARQIAAIKSAQTYEDLHKISPLHYEELKHQGGGITSFRINNSYVERVICREYGDYIELTLIELDNTHYGNKK